MLCAGIKTQKSALLSDEYDHFELSLRKRDVHRSSVSFHDFLYRRNTDSVRRGVGFIGDKALSSHPVSYTHLICSAAVISVNLYLSCIPQFSDKI